MTSTLTKLPGRIFRPAGATGPLPVLLYSHGAGWVFGDTRAHDGLLRELADRAQAATVLVNHQGVDEIYAALERIVDEGADHGLDTSRIAVVGDSVGGNTAAAVAVRAKQLNGPAITAQVLFYPVADTNAETGYLLHRDGLKWFRERYPAHRDETPVPPDDLAGLPPALVVVAEADEGEVYAEKLRAAGVPVTLTRLPGVIHDFVTLNALTGARTNRSATRLAGEYLFDALHRQ